MRRIFLVVMIAGGTGCSHVEKPTTFHAPGWEWASHLTVDDKHAVLLGIVIDSATGKPPEFPMRAMITPADHSMRSGITIWPEGRFAFITRPGENELEIGGGYHFPRVLKLTLKPGSFDTIRVVTVLDTAALSVARSNPPPAYHFDDGHGDLVGIVIDSSTGKPFSFGATAELRRLDSDTTISTRVDSAGGFVLHVSPGEYRLLVRSVGYNRYLGRTIILAEWSDTVRIALTRDLERHFTPVSTPVSSPKKDSLERDPERDRQVPARFIIGSARRVIGRIAPLNLPASLISP